MIHRLRELEKQVEQLRAKVGILTRIFHTLHQPAA